MEYEEVTKSLLEFYKRRGVFALEEAIFRIISRYFTADTEESVWETLVTGEWVVSSIPLFWIDERMRGYNISKRLAELFAGVFNYPTEFQLLTKNKPTLPQKDLTRSKRLVNLKGVFSARADLVRSKNIILIDDVWTTGTTLREAAKTLKRSGAKAVWGITLMRGI
jgi:ComF family protein